jgi:hypothetical protein
VKAEIGYPLSQEKLSILLSEKELNCLDDVYDRFRNHQRKKGKERRFQFGMTHSAFWFRISILLQIQISFEQI